jgi:hypothetical protein
MLVNAIRFNNTTNRMETVKMIHSKSSKRYKNNRLIKCYGKMENEKIKKKLN